MTVGARVVLDADFLCSFLKIGQLSWIREFFGVQDLLVPPAVLYEICSTDLVPLLTAVPGIRIQPPDARRVQALKGEDTFSRLGPGEQEAIALSLEKASSVLLMNDSRAGQIAARLGVDVFNIPGFLLSCKFSGSVSRKQMAGLVAALEKRDHYGFKKETRDLLLS